MNYHGEIEGYATNFMAANHWRITRTHGWDDAMQETWVVYDRVKRAYPHVEPKHFMALYKTALERHLINMSKVATRVAHAEISYDGFGLGDQAEYRKSPHTAMDQIGELDNAGYLRVLIKQAPREVSQVLALFLSAPAELVDAAMTAWRAGGHRESGGNLHVSKLLGLPPDSKPLDAVHDYFTDN